MVPTKQVLNTKTIHNSRLVKNQMKKRAVITVTGDVQSVGYREFVREAAVLYDLKGIVSNIPDDSVLIIVDGEPEDIDRFLIDILSPKPPASVKDHSVEYRPFDEIFQEFYVARDLEKNGDLSAKGEILIKYIQLILTEIRGNNAGIGGINQGITGLSHRIMDMDRHMGEHFDKLDRKYDTFGNKLDGMASDIKAMRELFAVFVEYFIKKENAEA
jgi:acylphosphatase